MTFCDEEIKLKNIDKKLEHQDSMHCAKFLHFIGVKMGHTDQIIEQTQKEIARQGEPQVDFVKVDDDAVMEDESNSTMVHSKPCRHHASEKCLNCSFCGKHMNEKSLVGHVRDVHSVVTTPSRKPKRKSCSKESTSSAPNSLPLKFFPKHNQQEDLSDDSSEPVPPVTSRSTPSARKLGEQGTGHSLARCAPPAWDLGHPSGQAEMVDVLPSIYTASEDTMHVTDGVNQNCTEASALTHASSARLFHSCQASLANYQPSQASLANSQPSQACVSIPLGILSSMIDPKVSERTGEVNTNGCNEVTTHLPQYSQERFSQAPQPSRARSVHLPQPSQARSVHLPQHSQARSVHVPQPSQARSNNLAQENLTVSVKQSLSSLTSSTLPTSYTVSQPHFPDCVKPLFPLGYSNLSLSPHQSAQPPSLKLAAGGAGHNSAPSAALPV